MSDTPADAVLIRQLVTPNEAEIVGLADVLVDCVEGGASVGFMLPIACETALAFWRRIAVDVARGGRILFVAEDQQGILGTVQIVLEQPENQPHRADLSKMLMHRRGRRRGIGQMLLQAAEAGAKAHGKRVLVLDTASDEAERLYQRQGWVLAGTVPDFALWPSGGYCSTRFYYRLIA